MSQQVNVRVSDDAQADLIRRVARVLREHPETSRQLQAVLDGTADPAETGRLSDLEARLFELEALLSVTPLGLQNLDKAISAGKTDKTIASLHRCPIEVVQNRRARLQHDAQTAKGASTS